jgi:hypothetical protein
VTFLTASVTFLKLRTAARNMPLFLTVMTKFYRLFT